MDEEHLEFPVLESSGSTTLQEVSLGSGDTAASLVEVIRCLVCKAGFLREVVEVVALNLRGSIAAVDQGK